MGNWPAGLSVHKNSPLFGGHSFHPRRLKFGMEVKWVCESVCVCVCVCLCQLDERERAKGSGLLQKGAHLSNRFTDLHKI